jgi:hypothetical protein
MKFRVIGATINPHLVNDLQPAVAESAQGIGVTLALLAMMLVITLGPDASRQTLLCKKMDGVPEMFVTSPAYITIAAFSGTFSDRRCSA